jgi:hypothetical protein
MLGKGKSLLKKSLRWQVVAGLVCLLLVPLIIVVTGCGGGGKVQKGNQHLVALSQRHKERPLLLLPPSGKGCQLGSSAWQKHRLSKVRLCLKRK